MGLFGDADASEVSDNPWYVAPDTYECVLTEVVRKEKKDGTGEGLTFKWVIEDEGDYQGLTIQDWKNIYPDVPQSEWTKEIRADNARLKGRLTQIGVPEEAMSDVLDNLDDLVGITAEVTVTETPNKKDPSKSYTNISFIRRPDLEFAGDKDE